VAKVAIGSLINMLKLLTLLLLAQLKIRYAFSKIYDTKVIDLSGNGYHAVKGAPGGPYMINTPIGLYLKRVRPQLPTEPYSLKRQHAQLQSSSDFQVRAVNTEREIRQVSAMPRR
jgi:hypothetical protein